LPPKRAGEFILDPDTIFFNRRQQLVALAARYAVPAIYEVREFVEPRNAPKQHPIDAREFPATSAAG
jgi:hypothetical protein